jgi:hypothetical protein
MPNLFRYWLSAAVVAVMCAGCVASDGPSPSLIDLPTAPPTPTADPTAAATLPFVTLAPGEAGVFPTPATRYPPGPCHHLLWPLDEYAVWTYTLTSPQESTPITLTAIPTAEGADLELDGITVTVACADSAVVGLPPHLAGHPDLGAGIAGSDAQGFFLPPLARLLPLGQPAAWDMQMAASGMIALPPGQGSPPLPIREGIVVLTSETGPMTSVTVPAGTFTALPIAQDIYYDLRVVWPDGTERRVLIDTSARLFFADGAGLVKIDYFGGTVSTSDETWTLPGGYRMELTGWSLR